MSRRNFHLPWAEYVETLQPHERPMLPGSPATPDHSLTYRLAYAAIGRWSRPRARSARP